MMKAVKFSQEIKVPPCKRKKIASSTKATILVFFIYDTQLILGTIPR